ncbi:hypothetical protein QBC35DRAFT_516406 [Podospora australis]|uniref:Uncharacterized protein n=1 Tax=Podospora australis TaxID=1536484 RepID=A0AAN6WTX9_9PEZI|nr:hypothetical protein QBC35DRAFT_516406 [Podospora australis]
MPGTRAILLVAGALLTSVANAARACNTDSYTYRILEARYDGPDQSKPGSNVSTIALSLGTSTTPLYECVAQWPEAWEGWYQGGDKNIIWTDCIWTGAGSGADKTVSVAVDWRKKVVHLSHTFACSNKQGSDGLATGTVSLADLECGQTDDKSEYCIPKPTTSGARPDLHISTKLAPAPVDTSSSCDEISKRYQSWRLEKWHRQFELVPGTYDPKAETDTGPSFSVENLATDAVLSCVTTGRQTGGVFEGQCKTESGSSVGSFTFDPKLHLLSVEQKWDCGNSSAFTALGVGYIQGTCDRGFNSVVFTCTSEPVWIGTQVV